MKEKELRRNLSIFPIGSVMKLTDLTARQIRYYETHGLVVPERNEGNRRMYSLNDMDRLLEIKDYISDGFNIAGIKRKLTEREVRQQQQLTDKQVRQLLHGELSQQSRFNTSTAAYGRFGR